jgi:acetyltransferase-like isoleucine patch superfamily enzyme
VIGSGTTIGKTSIIEPDVVIGDDCRIGEFCIIKSGSRLGDRVVFDDYADTSGAVLIGDDVMVKRRATITQGTIVEDKVFIGPGVMIVHEKTVSWQRDINKVSRGVYIKSGAIIGAGALLMAGVTVGRDAQVGAGAIVTKNCDGKWIYTGPRAGALRKASGMYCLSHEMGALMFEPRVLEKYLPDLVGVGYYDC